MSQSEDNWLLQFGEKILDWTVLRPLGRGGMGEVYLVERSSQPSYTYALKLFTVPQGTPDFFKNRFISVGEGLLQLSHPALAKLLYVGVFKRGEVEYPFSVMTFIGMSEPVYNQLLSLSTPSSQSPQPRAYSLADILARPAGLSLAWLDRWYQDVATGLQHLHASGFAHGDIKPTNILIDATGRAVLIDFGLATALSVESQPPGYEATQVAFQSSSVFRGTPAFTAPELLAGGSPTKASDWYSLGATFFFARTGVVYYPSTPMNLLIDSMESPWKERFKSLLQANPAMRHNVTPAQSASQPAPHRWPYLSIALIIFLLILTAGLATALLFPRNATPEAGETSTPILYPAANESLSLQLNEKETKVLALGANAVTLATCVIPDDATLIVQGPGHLQINRNEKAHFTGTLHLTNGTTVSFSGHHPNTCPKIVTTAGCHITASVGNNRRSRQQFAALDMSRGGTFVGDGIRFFINHQEPDEIRLGNGALLELPWISNRGVIHAIAGESELTGTNIHHWHSLWLYADLGATLTLSGSRFFMYDYWKGEEIVVDARNRGTIIFNYDVMRPLCKFHFKGGTTLMRCNMIQSTEENWCQVKTTHNWVVHPNATFCGDTSLTFHTANTLLVKPNGCLIAGEEGFGKMKVNRLTLEKDSILKAPGTTHFTCEELILQGNVTLDLADATAPTSLSWEKLTGVPEQIRCINIPKNMRVDYTPTAIRLIAEDSDGR